MHTSRRIIATLLLLAPIVALPQITQEAMPAMNIAALFDAGGAATGDMMMQGMPWPLLELSARDRAEVVAEATRRLHAPGKDIYTHAFCVKLLVDFEAPQLDAILLDAYTGLDAYGRYEVLLYGMDTVNPAYAPLLTAALEADSAVTAMTDTAVLSAMYASQSLDPALHAALQDWWSAHAAIGANLRNWTLDGFPYSDMVRRHVPDVARLFATALQTGAAAALLRTSPMTAAEETALADLRAQLLVPDTSMPIPGSFVSEEFPALVFQLRAQELPLDPEHLALLVSLRNFPAWLDSPYAFSFRLEALTSDMGPIELRRVSGSPYIDISLDGKAPEDFGKLTLRGTASLLLPAMLRNIELELPDADAFRFQDGTFAMVYEQTAEETSLTWGWPASCCASRRSLRPPYPDMLQIQDAAGAVRTERGKFVTSYGESGLKTPLGGNGAWQPARVSGTIFPMLERVEILLVFDGVTLRSIMD